MKKVILMAAMVLFFATGYGQQWVEGKGISGKVVKCLFEYNKDTLLAGVANNGIFISYDNGINWTPYALEGESVLSLVKLGKVIIAGTSSHDVFRAGSITSAWQRIVLSNLNVYSLKTHNNVVYAGTAGSAGPGGVYQSANAGLTWIRIGSTTPYEFLDIDISPAGRIFAATPYGAYYLNDATWTKVAGAGYTMRNVHYIGKDSIFVGGDMGLYLSKDNGVSMTEISNSYTPNKSLYSAWINDTLYTTNGNGIAWSTKPFDNWSNLSFDKEVRALIQIGKRFIAGTTRGIYYTSDSTVSIAEGYESIFGKQSTQWNITYGNLWGLATTHHRVAGDTVINGKEYKIIDGYEGPQEDYLGFLREDSIAGKAWYCSSENHEEILIMDMGLKLGDTFFIGGNWNYLPQNYEVDLVYEENNRKHIHFKNLQNFPNEMGFELIEGITSNMGFRYQDNEYSNNFYPQLLCSYKDGIQVFASDLPCDIVMGMEENEATNGIRVFPNPCSAVLNIQVLDNNIRQGKYTITNLEGKTVLKGSFATNKQVDLTSLPSGVYVMVFENEDGIIGQKKIVKD